MARRFTDTDKWRKRWFRSLTPAAKVLFLYLCDSCDIAGFWERDNERAAFETGLSVDDVERALAELDRTYEADSERLWLKNFIHHQGNLPLNPQNNAHRGILRLLRDRASLSPNIESLLDGEILPFDFEAPSEGLFRGLQGPLKPHTRGPGKGSGKGKGNGKSKERAPLPEQPEPGERDDDAAEMFAQRVQRHTEHFLRAAAEKNPYQNRDEVEAVMAELCKSHEDADIAACVAKYGANADGPGLIKHHVLKRPTAEQRQWARQKKQAAEAANRQKRRAVAQAEQADTISPQRRRELRDQLTAKRAKS